MKYKLEHVSCGKGSDYYLMNIHGVWFAVEMFYDHATRAPWANCDGHGPVRAGARSARAKTPGERPFGARYLYDWAEAIKLAKRDGWGVAPAKRPANWETLTAKQRVELAVKHDFDYLRGWAEDEWRYMVIGVAFWETGGPITDLTFADFCGGVETFEGYHEEYARESCVELLRGSTDIRHAAAYAVYLQENQK